MSSEPYPRTLPQNWYPLTTPVPAPKPAAPEPEPEPAWNQTRYCPNCHRYQQTDRHTQQVPTNTSNPHLPAFIVCVVCGWCIDIIEETT